jgi:hypothetical protein
LRGGQGAPDTTIPLFEGDNPKPMTEFDADAFEDKYANYFPELQKAYKQAFERMNEEYDSELVHGIDQRILSESEPFYEGDGEFRIELPEDPLAKIDALVVDEEKAEHVLETYLEELTHQHRQVFGFAEGDTA